VRRGPSCDTCSIRVARAVAVSRFLPPPPLQSACPPLCLAPQGGSKLSVNPTCAGCGRSCRQRPRRPPTAARPSSAAVVAARNQRPGGLRSPIDPTSESGRRPAAATERARSCEAPSVATYSAARPVDGGGGSAFSTSRRRTGPRPWPPPKARRHDGRRLRVGRLRQPSPSRRERAAPAGPRRELQPAPRRWGAAL
jgi:hypothetical protein